MKIGRVAGTVVSTICSSIYDRQKLLLCDYLDEELRPTGAYTIAVDRVGAGVGETVLILDEGNSARQVVAVEDAPIRAVIVGIVDAVGALEPPG